MATVVSFKTKSDKPWQAMVASLDPSHGAAFRDCVLEELSFEADSAVIHVGLLMATVPSEASAFEALRDLLGSSNAKPLLKVRYPGGVLTAADYLALHFSDLCLRIRWELGLESHWCESLDYSFLEDGSLGLLADGGLAGERLRQKKAGQRLAEWIKAGCGDEISVEIRAIEKAPPAPVAAPSLPAVAVRPTPSTASAPVAQPSPLPSQAEKVLLGKEIPKSRVREVISVVSQENSVVVEGRVFGLSELSLRDGRLKIKFAVTDGSDSILAVLWPKDGGRPKGLADGASVRLRGEAKVDRFEQDEMVIDVSDLALVPTRLGRQDSAALKRVELHAHTKMSAADAVVDPALYVHRAADWGHEAVGITDHGVVHAFPEAYKAAKARKIKLLLGMEAYLCNDVSFLKERERNGKSLAKAEIPPYYHAIVYVRNEAGRRNLYDLVTHSHVETFYKKPLLPREMLIQLREGLLIGSACEQGELIQAIVAGKDDPELEKIASFYDYLEVQPLGNNAFMLKNGTLKSQDDLKAIVRKVIALAEKLGKPVVAASDMHFLDPEDELYRRIMQVGNGMSDAEEQPPLYFHTTDEMLAEFAWLEDEALARRLVIDNPRAVAELCAVVPPVPDGRFFPELPGSEESISRLSRERAVKIYGAPLPLVVAARLDRELKALSDNKFSVLYEIARLLVEESHKRGFSVGSRGSVGSSLAAHLLDISEVNPLPAHERCPACHWSEFDEKQRLSGVDLKARPCPNCGGELKRDGHNIPFETFVGIKGDKVPDIDLNFAPEVQGFIQKYAEELFGKGRAFKAGTISTLQEKTAFGYVRKYFDAKGISKRKVEIERIKGGLEGVKKTSGQHPGGVILVRHDKKITDFTPVQFSGDGKEMGGREGSGDGALLTTHFDYHAIDENLVKLDILGKDDASAFRHLEELTGMAETLVPLDDPKALSLFSSQEALGFPKLSAEERELFGETGVVAIPEFGTPNTRRMLEMTRPRNFTELIYISGLSHGTNVWANNAETLIRDRKATLDTVISTRDDIMTTLIRKGMDPATAFAITEKVRKGAVATDGFSPEHQKALQAVKMETWWVDSCRKIKYMFPKAHAAAYCLTAARMAWFKVHRPRAFYASWLTLHAEDLEAEHLSRGRSAVMERLRELRLAREDGGKPSAKDESAFSTLVVAYEAMLRGIRFDAVDIYKSHPGRFMPGATEDSLLPPLKSMAGLGSTAAANLERERKLAPFRSVEDLARRAGLNKSVIDKLTLSGALDILPKSDQITLF